jgi:hypothetical protein
VRQTQLSGLLAAKFHISQAKMAPNIRTTVTNDAPLVFVHYETLHYLMSKNVLGSAITPTLSLHMKSGLRQTVDASNQTTSRRSARTARCSSPCAMVLIGVVAATRSPKTSAPSQ